MTEVQNEPSRLDVPPKGNANFAWVQHFIHHLAPHGMADLVDCMVALPGQLFYSTQIPACLWFCGKNNTLDAANDARLFDGETELSLVA